MASLALPSNSPWTNEDYTLLLNTVLSLEDNATWDQITEQFNQNVGMRPERKPTKLSHHFNYLKTKDADRLRGDLSELGLRVEEALAKRSRFSKNRSRWSDAQELALANAFIENPQISWEAVLKRVNEHVASGETPYTKLDCQKKWNYLCKKNPDLKEIDNRRPKVIRRQRTPRSKVTHITTDMLEETRKAVEARPDITSRELLETLGPSDPSLTLSQCQTRLRHLLERIPRLKKLRKKAQADKYACSTKDEALIAKLTQAAYEHPELGNQQLVALVDPTITDRNHVWMLINHIERKHPDLKSKRTRQNKTWSREELTLLERAPTSEDLIPLAQRFNRPYTACHRKWRELRGIQNAKLYAEALTCPSTWSSLDCIRLVFDKARGLTGDAIILHFEGKTLQEVNKRYAKLRSECKKYNWQHWGRKEKKLLKTLPAYPTFPEAFSTTASSIGKEEYECTIAYLKYVSKTI